MALPGGLINNPDKDFRLIHDETNGVYYIQKKRFFFGWKFLNFKSHEYNNALRKLTDLRVEHKKVKIKKHYVILND